VVWIAWHEDEIGPKAPGLFPKQNRTPNRNKTALVKVGEKINNIY
jgi:hypothetical protein